MKNLISIKSYNRPAYLNTCLNYLSRCKNIANYKILISCDYVDANMAEQIEYTVKTSGITHNPKTTLELIFHNQKVGCAGNFKYCFDNSFNSDEEFLIHLEDDIVCSQDTLLYFEHAVQLLDRNNLFAACAMHRPIHQTVPPYTTDANKLVSRRWFEPCGGFAMTRKQYDRIQEMGGVFGVNYISDKGRTFDCQGQDWLKEINKDFSLSWAWPFHKYFSEGKPSLYPKISRTLNIGRVGLHIGIAQHKKLHYNQNWMGDLQYYQNDIVFDNHFQIDDSKYIEHGVEE